MHLTFFINENERISRIVYFVYNLAGHIIVLECKDLYVFGIFGLKSHIISVCNFQFQFVLEVLNNVFTFITNDVAVAKFSLQITSKQWETTARHRLPQTAAFTLGAMDQQWLPITVLQRLFGRTFLQ